MAQSTRLQPSTSPAAMDALDKTLARIHHAPLLEDELQSHSFAQECVRQTEEEERVETQLHRATDGLQAVFAAPAAGALAAWRTKSGFPIGQVMNFILGGGAKFISLAAPKNKALRVTANTGKVFLHSQISMMTKSAFEETP